MDKITSIESKHIKNSAYFYANLVFLGANKLFTINYYAHKE